MDQPPNFVGFTVAMLLMITGNEVSRLLGPYAAIIVCAGGGAAISLSGHDNQLSIMKALIYLATRMFAAVVLTVSFSELLFRITEWAPVRSTISPIAFLIGWITDFDKLKVWIVSRLRAMLNRKVKDVE